MGKKEQTGLWLGDKWEQIGQMRADDVTLTIKSQGCQTSHCPLTPSSLSHTDTHTHTPNKHESPFAFQSNEVLWGAQNYAFCALWNGDLLKDQKNSVYLSRRGDRKMIPFISCVSAASLQPAPPPSASEGSCIVMWFTFPPHARARERFGCTAKVERIVLAQ